MGNKPGAFYFYTNTDGVTGQIVHQVTGAFPTKSTTVETYQIQAKDIKKGIMKGIMFERGREWNYKKELIFIL